jgi:predicted metal-dependent hydrolase
LAHYRLHALLTDDTIRALLDVAEAAQAVVEYIDQDYFTVDEEKVVVALIAALAPLTKEADSE